MRVMPAPCRPSDQWREHLRDRRGRERLAHAKHQREGKVVTNSALGETIVEGAAKRLRPKLNDRRHYATIFTTAMLPSEMIETMTEALDFGDTSGSVTR